MEDGVVSGLCKRISSLGYSGLGDRFRFALAVATVRTSGFAYSSTCPISLLSATVPTSTTQQVFSIRGGAIPGLRRAHARVKDLDEQELAWQIAVIRPEHEYSHQIRWKGCLAVARQLTLCREATEHHRPTRNVRRRSRHVADEITRYAIRRGSGAAWIGLDWLGDSEVAQLVPLGPDLYNGISGDCPFSSPRKQYGDRTNLFERACSRRRWRAFRKNLKSRNAARTARVLGIGGAFGLGSIVYALAVMSKFLATTSC